MRLPVIALMTLPFLTACSSTIQAGSNGLSVPSYTAAQTKQVYEEVTKDGVVIAPMTVEFLKDYYVLRQQARVK